MAKRAFLSVWEKAGIVDFAKGLADLGYEILSTGGTERVLKEAGVPVTNVSDVTGFPECLDGRVKTLHPKIHAGILAMRDNASHMQQLKDLDVTPIDIVAVNLYPFQATIQKENVALEEAIENIDIGGPTMLRAAAKNWKDVLVIVDQNDYAKVLDALKKDACDQKLHFDLAAKVFETTAAYDALIAEYLRNQKEDADYPERLTLTFEKVQPMRYGENPHQSACFYREAMPVAGSLAGAEQLWGKELSYNNINDANGALDALREYGKTTVVAAKHANPCGIATAESTLAAYQKAFAADPVSIFGGIVATNGIVDGPAAEEMKKTFLEIIIAPDYTAEALEILKQKKNLRLLKLPDLSASVAGKKDMKKVLGGLLVQDYDAKMIDASELRVVTTRKPTEKEMQDLLFAWKAVKHTKSNAIVIAKNNATLGIGPGQVNRIWAAQSAIERSGADVQGAVLASDAFFPFSDCVEAAGKAGISAIIQPGGAMRDQESIDMANQYGIAMVFTGMRHFKH